jgi:plasmid stabilization system protein ParE
MKLKWSDRALRDLERIGDFIAEDDPGAANRLVSRLWQRAVVLKSHPRLGRVVPELCDQDLREIIDGNYRIVYQLADHEILIVTVFEGHRMFLGVPSARKV